MSARALRWVVLAVALVAPALPQAAPAKPPRDPAKAARLDYANDIAPVIGHLGCAAVACHGAAQGKGGFKLSLFGGDPEIDYYVLTRTAGGRRINRVEPARSLLLTKATATVPHTGGKRLAPGTPEYQAVVDWVAQGALWLNPDKPVLTSLRLSPAEVILPPGTSLALEVTAVYDDGTERDVTGMASFRANDPAVATVDSAGKATAKAFGQGDLVATYHRKPAVMRVIVPQALPQGFPPVAANNRIDELCAARWKKLGLPPSELSTDPVFLRRVYLDALGLLPTPDEARAFLTDAAPDKRAKLIDRLLDRDEFTDAWALKWGDLLRIKSEYPVRVWPKAVMTYDHWLRDSLAANKPYDQFVRELLTATGSNFRSGPANYFRAVTTKDPQTFGETTAQVFMGARLACARCHGHPYEDWNLEDDVALGAVFAQVRFKATQEWKEEVVFLDPGGVLWHPRMRNAVAPKFLGGETPKLEPGADARQVFCDWLTAPGNPWFARNAANRVWAWLFGRGLIHEPDDIRPTNPPSNPELLDWLAGELVTSHYDLKHLYRVILNSRTYQLASTATRWNQGDVSLCSHYPVKRLPAEALLDAVCQVTETHLAFSSSIPEPYTHLPPETRAGQVPDGSIENPFLALFGRPPRDTAYESDRCARISQSQAMQLVNSSEIEGKVVASERLKRLAGQPDAAVVDELYLAALSRFPTETERQTVTRYLARDPSTRPAALQDVLWALLNTKEFLFIR